MQNRESCVINRGTTTTISSLKEYQIQFQLFILVLEIAFLFMMQNENIHDLNIFYTQRIQTILHFFL